MTHVILSEDLLDAGFVKDWCVGVDELRERAGEIRSESCG